MDDAVTALARRMLLDFDAKRPGRVFTEPCDVSTAEAYALQAEVARLREARGEHLIGYKVGCTSRTVQTQIGVSEPIFGRVFDSGCHPAGTRLSASHFANLAVEGELPTPNADVIYSMNYLDLKKTGPLVVAAPPNVIGIDSWHLITRRRSRPQWNSTQRI